MAQVQHSQIANTVIDILGIPHIRDEPLRREACSITAAQQKRVSIAVELAAKPSVLLLDEPTAWFVFKLLPWYFPGPNIMIAVPSMDSVLTLQLLKAMRATVEQGITAVVTLQTSRYDAFCLFHDVMMLIQVGRWYITVAAKKQWDILRVLVLSFQHM